MSTMWTRLTGWLTMLGTVNTLLWWQIPHGLSHTPLRQRFLPLAATCVFVLLWVVASLFARRRARRTDLVKRAPKRESKTFPAVLGLVVTMYGTAALMTGVGPDGAEGRWAQQVHDAGGGLFDVPIVRVVSKPARTGVNINDHDEYRATLVLRVTFVDDATNRLGVLH